LFFQDASEYYILDLKKSMIIHRDLREMEWKFKVIQMATKDGNQLLHDVSASKVRARSRQY
jgi:hypothetical protein